MRRMRTCNDTDFPRSRDDGDDGSFQHFVAAATETFSSGTDDGSFAARAKALGLAQRRRNRARSHGGHGGHGLARPLSAPVMASAGFAVPATPLHHDVSAQDFSSFLTIDEEEVDSPESSTAGAGAGVAAAAAAAAVEHRKQRQEERERERQRRAALWLCSGGVVVFGCLSVIPVEFMLRRDPSAMEAITVSNYAFCVLEGLFSAGPAALLGARRIPLSVHAGIFFTALVYNVAQNKAVELGLPLALVLLLKNSQLLFQMLANALVSGEVYNARHGAAALAVTVGVCLAIFSTSSSSSSSSSSSPTSSWGGKERPTAPAVFAGACLCMVAANAARSLSNIGTQKAFARFGPATAEKVWYEHALGLPLLLLLGGGGGGGRSGSSGGGSDHATRLTSWTFDHVVDVGAWLRSLHTTTTTTTTATAMDAAAATASGSGAAFTHLLQALLSSLAYLASYLPANFPVLWWYLFLSMVFTFLCTRACARVMLLSDSVFLSLVLAVQRFVSIAFSAGVVNAPPYPPAQMWFGALLVAAGCIFFIHLPPPQKGKGQQQQQPQPEPEKKIKAS